MNRFSISLIIILLPALMLEAAEVRWKRDVFGDIDPNTIPAMLNNAAFVEAQHKCLQAAEADVNTKCDRVGKKLRTNLVDSIKKGDCSTPCTDKEKLIIVTVIETVQKKYDAVWKDLVKDFKITDEELKNLDAWIKSVKSKNVTQDSKK